MMMRLTLFLSCFALLPGVLQTAEPPAFTVKLETVMKHDDGKFLWFHPRAAVIPGGAGETPTVMMTIQKHLKVSDYYSGLHFMTREGVEGPWTGPVLTPALDWTTQDDGVTVSVADVTPGWHEKTGKLIAIGAQVRYNPAGKQLEDVKRAHQTVYAVYESRRGARAMRPRQSALPNPHLGLGKATSWISHPVVDGVSIQKDAEGLRPPLVENPGFGRVTP
jgi:hypothetical protein